jgi:IclR family acetate operon transcriptional repressor
MKTESKDNRSADRTLAILEAFEDRKRSLTLRELAECCDIPVSTCHSLVHTLLNRSYLYQTSRRKDLYPTRRILDLAATIVAHDPFLERMTPVLERLRSETQETVILGKRQKDQIIYLEVLESPQTIRYSSRAGEFKPMHSTCIGKAMLGSLNASELAAWLKEHPLPKVTGNTITTQSRLLEDLRASVERGYFMTRGENVADVTAISVPLRVNNELLGLAVAGPSHRMDAQLDKQVQRLVDAQRRMRKEGIASS